MAYTISEDKTILLSPMCFLQFIRSDVDNDSRNYLKYIVKQRMDSIGDIQVNLDGENIANQLVRAASDLFSLDYVFTAASDGYWLQF